MLQKSTITNSCASYVDPGLAQSALMRSEALAAEAAASALPSKIYNNELSHHTILARRSAQPEPEPEGEPIYKRLFEFNNEFDNNNNTNNKFNNVNYPGQGLQDPINSGHFKEKRSAEPEPEAEAEPIGKSLFKFNNEFYNNKNNNNNNNKFNNLYYVGLFNFKEKRFGRTRT